jgi:hypothetical protein
MRQTDVILPNDGALDNVIARLCQNFLKRGESPRPFKLPDAGPLG